MFRSTQAEMVNAVVTLAFVTDQFLLQSWHNEIYSRSVVAWHLLRVRSDYRQSLVNGTFLSSPYIEAHLEASAVMFPRSHEKLMLGNLFTCRDMLPELRLAYFQTTNTGGSTMLHRAWLTLMVH